MSIASYLYHGASGPNQQYCHQQYPNAEVKSIATTNQYLGKLGDATKIDDTREEVVIDSAVKVTSVAQKIREKAINFWNKAKSGSFIAFTAVLITGILAGGAAIALGTVLPELWIIAASVGTVALVILSVSIFLLTRAIGAGNRLKAWKEDPVANAQNDRVRIGKEGFYPAFAERKKGVIVSEKELQALWSRDMDSYVKRFDNDGILRDSTKIAMVREFIKKSPLANAALNYTFTDVEPSIRRVNTKFVSVKSSADTIRRQSEALKNKINSKKRNAMRENDSHRDELLLPYRLMIKPRQSLLQTQIFSLRSSIASQRNQVAQLSARRTHVVTQPRHTVVGRRGNVMPGQRGNVMPGQRISRPVNRLHINQLRTDIQLQEMTLRELERELAHINTIYLAMTLPIKNMHARNETRIKAWARNEIAKIEMDEDKLFKKFFNPIQDILREYATRNSDKPIEAEEIKGNVGTLNMETPPIEQKYEPVTYHDSWKGIIDEFEWKKKQAELIKDQLVPSQMK